MSSYSNLFFVVLVLHLKLTLPYIIPEVEDLQGLSDYRSVILTWRYGKQDSTNDGAGFIVRYCEVFQDTRRQLCAQRLYNGSDNIVLTPSIDRYPARYSAIIDGLRLSTGYYFDVMPTKNEDSAYLLSASPQTDIIQPVTSGLYIATKGFRARVTKCLRDYSELEIDTGPHFGGLIEVEGTTHPKCSINGDASSSLSKYILIISHDLCGSQKKGRYVESIVVANENPNVITQSSRRFNVVCDIIPENHTLQTIINVPLESGLMSHDPPFIFSQHSSSDKAEHNDNAKMLQRHFEESVPRTSTEDTSQVQLIIVGAMLLTVVLIVAMTAWLWWRHKRKGSSDSSSVDRAHIIPSNDRLDTSDYATNSNNNNNSTINNNNLPPQSGTDISLTSHRSLHFH